MESVFAASEDVENIPPLSLLRCTFEELESNKEKAITTELLFETLEAKNAWIGSEDGAGYAVSRFILQDHIAADKVE